MCRATRAGWMNFGDGTEIALRVRTSTDGRIRLYIVCVALSPESAPAR
jgi:hypothetical protein